VLSIARMNLRHTIVPNSFVTLLALATASDIARADPPQSGANPPRAASAPEAPRPIYRFEFAVRRSDDPPNARPASYTMNLEENHPGTLSVGSNVPLQTPSSARAVAPRQDVGLMLHFDFAMQGSTVVLTGSVEISSAEPMTNGVAGIRRFRADGAIPIVPGRTTPFVTVADASTHNTYEITVTATRLQ
jgi:hypothetical protein